MSGVFQNIDPPTPLTARRVCTPPRLWCGGRTHSLAERGVGGQYFGRRQAQLCTLYICKYFVLLTLFGYAQVRAAVLLHGHADGQLQGEETLSRPPTPGGRWAHARGRAKGQLSPPLFYPVLRIHDILVWIRIRIRESMPLTSGSRSFYFHH
jgi:hypothetical protein